MSSAAAVPAGVHRGTLGHLGADPAAQTGADLVVSGRSAAQNDAAAAQLTAAGHRVLTAQVDVTDEAQVVEGVAAALAEMGRIDSVFASAGSGGLPVPFVESTTAHLRMVFGPNVDGVY